jgi:hypothetical protein
VGREHRDATELPQTARQREQTGRINTIIVREQDVRL